MIFRDGRCVAVLDWEMATLGPRRDGPRLVPAPRPPPLRGHRRAAPSRDSRSARDDRALGSAAPAARAEHVAFWEAFAAWRFAVIMARIGGQMQHYEILPADSNFAADNTASRLLAKMLGLAAPG